MKLKLCQQNVFALDLIWQEIKVHDVEVNNEAVLKQHSIRVAAVTVVTACSFFKPRFISQPVVKMLRWYT